LTKQLEEASSHTLSEQRLAKIVKLHDDLCKETKLFDALQNRCEQLLEAREGVTEEMRYKEIESGEEARDLYSETLHQADELKSTLDLYLSAQSVARDFHTLMGVLDPSVGEFEKDSTKMQRRLSAFLSVTASHENDEIIELREQFMTYEGQLMEKLNESRLLRKRVPKSVSPTPPEPVRHTGSSSLRLELPEFSGHPLDWHHFSELFTTALERAGHGLLRQREVLLFAQSHA